MIFEFDFDLPAPARQQMKTLAGGRLLSFRSPSACLAGPQNHFFLVPPVDFFLRTATGQHLRMSLASRYHFEPILGEELNYLSVLFLPASAGYTTFQNHRAGGGFTFSSKPPVGLSRISLLGKNRVRQWSNEKARTLVGSASEPAPSCCDRLITQEFLVFGMPDGGELVFWSEPEHIGYQKTNRFSDRIAQIRFRERGNRTIAPIQLNHSFEMEAS